MGSLHLSRSDIVLLFAFQSSNLSFGEDEAFFSNAGLQSSEMLFEVTKLMPEPDASYTTGRYKGATLG